jgi:arylsulfatase A-like enzyme
VSSAGRARRASGELCRRAARDGKRLAVLLLALAASACGGARPLTRPDIVLVSLDSTRLDHLGCYGYERPTTPHLDAVAAESVVYTRARSTSSWTLPAHASLFTGQYPASHGARYDRDGPLILSQGVETTAANRELLEEIRARGLPAGERTLAAVLAEAGYDTAGVVAGPWLKRVFGLDRGFAHYDDEGIEAIGGRPADAVTDAALRWLRESRREPFFLFVHYFDPHSPYVPPPALAARFGADRAAPGRERAIALYDGEIAFADLGLARLIETLREEGLDEDTLVVVTGDHGEGLLDHGYMFHGVHIYEEAVHVPLVFRWPGTIPAGRTIAEPVELVHVAPSVLDLLGLEEEARALPGRSFAPALRGEDALDAQAPVYLQRRHFRPTVLGDPDDGGLRVRGEKFGVRIGEWKYIVGPEEKSEELFQLGDDPGERVNLVGELPRKAAELSARLAAWREARGPSGAPVDRVAEEDREALEALGYVE